MLILDQTDFKSKKVMRNKGHCMLILMSRIHRELLKINDSNKNLIQKWAKDKAKKIKLMN